MENENKGTGFRKWIWEPALGLAALAALISLAIASPQNQGDKEISIEELPDSVREVIALQQAESELESFTTLDGFEVKLFAWEPKLVNPIRLDVAPDGTVFVVETYRWDLPWMQAAPDADAQAMDFLSGSIENAISRLKPSGIWSQDGELRESRSERIKMLLDLDQDGVADTESNYAEGFQGRVNGIAGGLLVHQGSVWLAQAPQIWKLRDADGNRMADSRRSVLYGIHSRLSGAGPSAMTALAIGPDNRLYFAVNDRGIDSSSLQSIRGIPSQLDLTRTGAVYSCELDGTDWELIAWGLCSPSDLVFNDAGDLFVADLVYPVSGDAQNEPAIATRIYHVTMGADFGWRAGYGLKAPIQRSSAWNSEKTGYLSNAPADFRSQFIYRTDQQITGMMLAPEVSAFHDTGAQEGNTIIWAEVDKKRSTGKVQRTAIRTKGPGYTLNPIDTILQPIAATDLAMDWRGSMLVTDWTAGTEAPYKGRIFRIQSVNPELKSGPAGLDRFLNRQPELDESAWLEWLAHPDYRIRAMASTAISERGPEWLAGLEALLTASALTGTADNPDQTLAAVDALAGIATKYPRAGDALIRNARHPNPIIRSGIAKALGSVKSREDAVDALLQGLQDPESNVRRRSVEALGKLRAVKSIQPILDRSRTIDGQDPVLRQAFVFALGAMSSAEALKEQKSNPSQSVRLVSALALQRIQGSAASVFLWDEDSRVATEAARAVYSDSDRAAYERLADRIATPMDSMPLAYRTLWAHHRLGDSIRARALAFFASNPNAPENLRLEALTILENWGRAPDRDPVTGQKGWIPWNVAPLEEVKRTVDRAINPYLNQLKTDPSNSIRGWVERWQSPVADQEIPETEENETASDSGNESVDETETGDDESTSESEEGGAGDDEGQNKVIKT